MAIPHHWLCLANQCYLLNYVIERYSLKGENVKESHLLQSRKKLEIKYGAGESKF